LVRCINVCPVAPLTGDHSPLIAPHSSHTPPTHMRAHTHTHIPTHALTRTHTHTDAVVCSSHTHTSLHTPLHTHTHTHTHTHIYIRTHTCCEGPRRPPYVVGCGLTRVGREVGKKTAGDGGFPIKKYIY